MIAAIVHGSAMSTIGTSTEMVVLFAMYIILCSQKKVWTVINFLGPSTRVIHIYAEALKSVCICNRLLRVRAVV